MIKLNVDGATNKNSGLVAVGLVARDAYGNTLGWASLSFKGLFSPRTTEAMGFREAMVFAANHGLANIIIEGDSQQVVNALTRKGNFYSDCCAILPHCINLLPLFSSCTFVHVNRLCSSVAHS